MCVCGLERCFACVRTQETVVECMSRVRERSYGFCLREGVCISTFCRERRSASSRVRERVCVRVRRYFYSQIIMNIKNKNLRNTKRKKKIQMNVVYHMRMYANVCIRPPNWTYANIRNYALIFAILGQFSLLEQVEILSSLECLSYKQCFSHAFMITVVCSHQKQH